jgi:hypothetical protein
VADIEAVRTAITQVIAQLEEIDEETRRKIPDLTVAALIRDLDVAFAGRLESGHLVDVEEVDPVRHRAARLRLTLTSDDLLDVVAGTTSFARAWAKGRIKVDAKLRDILELRSFL